MKTTNQLAESITFSEHHRHNTLAPVATNDILSVIVPVLSDNNNPEALYRAYIQHLNNYAARVEFVFVLDRQARRTQAALMELKEAGEPITVVTLSRSEGEAAILRSGFQRTSGDMILTLPAYHQIAPSELTRVLDALGDCDLVLVRRTNLKHSWFGSILTTAFHNMTRTLFGRGFSDLSCRVRVYRRQVIEEVGGYHSHQHFLPMLAAKQGFHIREVDVGSERVQNDSLRVTSPKIKPLFYLRLLLDTLVLFIVLKFVRKPMRFFGSIGMPIFATGLFLTTWLAIERLFFGVALADRPALILSVLLIVLGIQVVALGLMGEIINFASSKKSKDYAVDRVISAKNP